MSKTMMNLIGETDARVWAREFVRLAKLHPAIPTDEGTMIGWFANAIMAGHDGHPAEVALRENYFQHAMRTEPEQ